MTGSAENVSRYAAFLETEPVVPILNRNLLFLEGHGRSIETIELNADLRCYSRGETIVIGGAPYLLRDEFEAPHWLSALRVLLAREVQHRLSSDKRVQNDVKGRFSAFLREKAELPATHVVWVAGTLHGILEDGRVDNMVCVRFPGYIPMFRFTNFARCLHAQEQAASSVPPVRALEELILAVACYALTGQRLGILSPKQLRMIDRAILSKSAAECGERTLELLCSSAELIIGAIRALPSSVSEAEDLPPDYAFDAESREEQNGEGVDSGLRETEDSPLDILSQVIGAGKGDTPLRALSESQTKEMLFASVTELDREKAWQKANQIQGSERTALSKGQQGGLKTLYAGVRYTETVLTPGSASLSAAEIQQAKALHRRLDRLLREQRIRREGERSGTLSRKSLWKLAVQDDDVFSRKRTRNEIDCAFYLLIDKSGSMGSGNGPGEARMTAALRNASVIEEALKGLAHVKIVAFDGGLDEVEHFLIRDFDQKPIGNRCADALSQLLPGNGNKDGYSIRHAGLELSWRPEKRKLLILLSDGLPSGYRSESAAVSDVRSAVQEIRGKGIIMIPIVYGEDAEKSMAIYQQMYEKGILCADQDTILREFEKLLVSLII